MSIKEGDYYYFCNCLLKDYREHTTAPDNNDNCVYCGYHTVYRQATAKDVRSEENKRDKLRKLKLEALDILIKDRRYDDKVN